MTVKKKRQSSKKKKTRAKKRKSRARKSKKKHRLKQGALDIQNMNVDDLHAASYNPRKTLSKDYPAYHKIARSLEAFGYVDTLVWNRETGNLVSGHQRLQVLKDQGVERVDVSVVDLSPAEELALNVAMNRVSGEWDHQKLAAVLSSLSQDGEIDETLTGFDSEEIDKEFADVMKSLEDSQKRSSAKAVTVSESYGVLVECKDERAQRKLYDEMTKRKLKCRVLTI